jgi:toxin ParE1/3/4
LNAVTAGVAESRGPVIWSPEAEADLFEIWNYLKREATVAVADGQLRLIGQACVTLSEWPESGRPRDDVLSGLRSVVVVCYVVFYRLTSDAVQIVRLLHGSRDIDPIFSTDP